MKFVCALVVAASLSFAGLNAQQSVRDVPQAPVLKPGTAVLAGVVMIDGPDGRPARGAIVTINHADKLHGDTAIADEQGRFAFRGVPAGRYLLTVEKESYITARYGATRPGRAGTPIAISEGQQLTDLALRLVRGAVLTGTVRDADGDPVQGINIAIKRVVTTAGKRRVLDTYASGGSTTDDRGVYRLYGLPADDYLIQLVPNVHSHDGGASGARPITAADVAWARALLSSPAGVGARTATQPPPPAGSSVDYAPLYYPNTVQQSAASVITLTAGEERTGLDVTMTLFSTFRVSGSVRTADGRVPAKPPAVFLAELGGSSGWYGVKESGGVNFVFNGVAPGSYAVAAIDEDSKMWAIANVTVASQDLSVTLTLQPGLTVSGQLVFEGGRPAPPDMTRVEVYLMPVLVAGGLAVQPQSTNARADGGFTLTGLVPGSYRLGSSAPDGRARSATSWFLRSAMVGDQDIADVPLEIRAGSDPGKIVVSFTDRPTELSGQLQDASGRAASDYFIIVFSADERTWFEESRRIMQTRPASDGRFLVRGLPPGDYLIAALTDVERDEWFDAGFLRQLIATSAKITLAEGERKIQDIRIKLP